MALRCLHPVLDVGSPGSLASYEWRGGSSPGESAQLLRAQNIVCHRPSVSGWCGLQSLSRSSHPRREVRHTLRSQPAYWSELEPLGSSAQTEASPIEQRQFANGTGCVAGKLCETQVTNLHESECGNCIG
jgi:hypothetical protein